MLPRGILKEHATLLSWIARIADVVLFLGASILAFYLQFHNLYFLDLYWVALLLAAVLIVPVFSFFGVYASIRGRSLWRHLKDLYLALIVLMLILAAITFITKTGPVFSRAWFSMWAGLAVILLTSFRIALRFILHAMRRRGWNQRKVLIIGTSKMRQELTSRIKNNICSGFVVVEVLDSKNVPENLNEHVEQLKVDEVWLGLPLKAEAQVEKIMTALRYNIVTVRYFPDVFGVGLLNHSATTEILGLSAINIVSSPMEGINRFIKAIEDRFLSLIILILASPLMLLIAVIIKLTSKGPVFYKQWRHGWDGKPILIYKFRSMMQHEEAKGVVTQAKKDDVRITKVGKFLRKTSLDELPQFINVLQGKMSIVGPRPHALEHNEMYKPLIPAYMQRHHVKPGITGWAQVNGWRGETDTVAKMQKRIEFDLYYIENWSLWFDLKIIWLTIFRGFTNKNAY